MKKQKKKIRMITREFLVSILGQYYLLEYVQPNVGQLPVRKNEQGERNRLPSIQTKNQKMKRTL